MTYYYYNKNSSNQYGDVVYRQKTIDKQKQSLQYSYENLFHLFSTDENIGVLKNEQYGRYNIYIATTYEDLKSEFVCELQCYELFRQMNEKNMVNIYFQMIYQKGKYY